MALSSTAQLFFPLILRLIYLVVFINLEGKMKEILLLFPVSPKYLFAPFPQLQACIHAELLKVGLIGEVDPSQ